MLRVHFAENATCEERCKERCEAVPAAAPATGKHVDKPVEVNRELKRIQTIILIVQPAAGCESALLDFSEFESKSRGI